MAKEQKIDFLLRSFTVSQGAEVLDRHSLAYVMDVDSRKWFKFDGSHIPQIVEDIEDIKRELSEEATILFYERM